MSDPHTEPVDRLAHWYDDSTLARIDAALASHAQSTNAPSTHVQPDAAQEPESPPSRARTTTAGVALAVAALTGVRDVVEPEPDEIFEEIDPQFGTDGDQFVTLYFVPNNPKASRAVVKPWLAPSVIGTDAT